MTHPNDPHRPDDSDDFQCGDCGQHGDEETLLICLDPKQGLKYYRCEECHNAHENDCEPCKQGYELGITAEQALRDRQGAL